MADREHVIEHAVFYNQNPIKTTRNQLRCSTKP